MSESDFSVFFLLITNEDWSNIGMKRWQAHSTYQMRANQKSQFELCTSDMWITWRCSFSVSLDCKLQSAVKVGLSHSQNKSVTSGIIRGLQEEQWAGSCCSSVLGGENSITGKFAQSSGTSFLCAVGCSAGFESYKTNQVTWKHLIISFTGKNIISVRDGLWSSITEAKLSSRFLAFLGVG